MCDVPNTETIALSLFVFIYDKTKILAYFLSWFLSNVLSTEPSWKERNTKNIIMDVPELVIIMTLQLL